MLRIFRSILCENNSHKFFFFNGFFTLKIIFQFDNYFAFTAMTVNMQLLISTQGNFFPRDIFIQTYLDRVEDYKNMKICCCFGELLGQPVPKIPPNSAQKSDSIIYEIYVYNHGWHLN